ncbi:MAG: hypothetical protein JO323_02225, partial [Acidobacteriia bacterium]|nr:hypothetical protein [Terriglobia bacterium]
ADPAVMHQVITNPPSAPFSWTEDGHWAWANAKAGQSIPVCGSFYSQAPFTPWETWFDEVLCVATDGSGTVWRMAHHRSTYNGNFWSEPRGNVSQDGRFFIFTSNWDQTLDPTGQRLDVFLVDLASAGAKKVSSPIVLR